MLFVLMALPCALVYGQPRVSSAFTPPVVTTGELSKFEISIEGDAEANTSLGGQLPQLPGLTLSNTASTQQSVSIINGRTSRTLTYQFTARADREGVFTTPPFQISVGGEIVTVPSATLRVVPLGEEMKSAAFVELEGVPEQVYAGQALALRLTLWVRADVRLRNIDQPTIACEGFVIDNLDNNLATQSMQARNGMRYVTISWPVLATAVKAGTSTVSYSIPIVIDDPTAQKPQRRSIFEFDPFGREALKQLNLANQTETTVINLPSNGRPPDFSGAIGHFEISSNVSATSTRVGEPVELSLAISGNGNFSQINPPRLEEGTAWRSYPPTSDFQKTGQLGNEGVLKLDYLLSPTEAGDLQLPTIRFTYFDPERRTYIVKEIPQERVAVAQSERAPTLAAGNAEVRNQQRTPQDRLRPIELLPSRNIGELKPIFLKPTFWAVQAAPALALAGLLGFRIRQRRLEANPERKLVKMHRAEARAALGRAGDAASKGDAPQFYQHARTALQRGAAAVLRKERAESIDAGVVEQALALAQHEGGDPKEIFSAFDAVRFSGEGVNGNLTEHEAKLRAMLGALTGRKAK